MENERDPKAISSGQLIRMILIRLVSGMILLGGLLFIPAGSLGYWNAWLYLSALFIPMLFTIIYLFIRNPALLEKRMRLREKERKQKKYIKVSLMFFIISFAIPGLDYRYHWSNVPLWLVILSTILMILGYLMFIAAMIQNPYSSRVIEIQDNQKVIDSGLYSVVRHPMYLAATILYLFSPIVLGSFYGAIPMLLLPIILAYRIKNEEDVLIKGLEGYKKYMQEVKYRLIPYIW